MIEQVSKDMVIGIDADPCDHWSATWVTPAMTKFVKKATWLPAVRSFNNVVSVIE